MSKEIYEQLLLDDAARIIVQLSSAARLVDRICPMSVSSLNVLIFCMHYQLGDLMHAFEAQYGNCDIERKLAEYLKSKFSTRKVLFTLANVRFMRKLRNLCVENSEFVVCMEGLGMSVIKYIVQKVQDDNARMFYLAKAHEKSISLNSIKEMVLGNTYAIFVCKNRETSRIKMDEQQ